MGKKSKREKYEDDDEVENRRARKGHNSGDYDQDDEDETSDVGGVSGKRLRSFVERVERLEEEKKALAEDIRDVYSEAKATGFEPKIIRKVVSIRKTNAEKRREEEELLELYLSAIGME